MIGGIGIYYPDKRPTQRTGIAPDIEVHPTLAGIRAGRDEVVETALRQILGMKKPTPKFFSSFQVATKCLRRPTVVWRVLAADANTSAPGILAAKFFVPQTKD